MKQPAPKGNLLQGREKHQELVTDSVCLQRNKCYIMNLMRQVSLIFKDSLWHLISYPKFFFIFNYFSIFLVLSVWAPNIATLYKEY